MTLVLVRTAGDGVVPAPRPAPSEPETSMATPPVSPEWLQPHVLTVNPAEAPVYALPTARHGNHVVAAVGRPGKPDGEVVTGPYPPR